MAPLYRSDPFIGTIEEAPEFLKVKTQLVTGFRINFNTYELAYKSVFMLHNETMNVWTHALGSSAFVIVLGYVIFWLAFLSPVTVAIPAENNDIPLWPLVIHAIGAILQMGLSAYFHLFHCVCEHSFHTLQKLDFAGIALMLAGSVTPPYYYGFIC